MIDFLSFDILLNGARDEITDRTAISDALAELSAADVDQRAFDDG